MASGSWGFLGINLSQAWSSLREGIVNITFVSNFFPKQQQEEGVEKAPSQASSYSSSSVNLSQRGGLDSDSSQWEEGSIFSSRSTIESGISSQRESEEKVVFLDPEFRSNSSVPIVLNATIAPPRGGNKEPVVLTTRSIVCVENEIGLPKFLEEDHTAMENLKQKFQNLFSETDSAKIANELREIYPGFKKSRKIYQEPVNQNLIDSAFALLGEIANNPNANIIKSRQIIEIADNIIEYYKPIRTKKLTEDWYKTYVLKDYNPTPLDKDGPSQPIGPKAMEVRSTMTMAPEEDDPSVEVGIQSTQRPTTTITKEPRSRWLRNYLSGSRDTSGEVRDKAELYGEFLSKTTEEKEEPERQEKLKKSLMHHFSSYKPLSFHNEILRMKKNFPIPINNGIQDKEMTTKINEAFVKMNNFIVQKKPDVDFSIEEMQIIEFSLKKTQELPGRAIRRAGVSAAEVSLLGKR